MKFERGMKVFLTSENVVRTDGILCYEAEFVQQFEQECMEIQHPLFGRQVIHVSYVFPSRIDAEAAGRAHVKQCMAEERKAFEERMGKLHKMLKEER